MLFGLYDLAVFLTEWQWNGKEHRWTKSWTWNCGAGALKTVKMLFYCIFTKKKKLKSSTMECKNCSVWTGPMRTSGTVLPFPHFVEWQSATVKCKLANYLNYCRSPGHFHSVRYTKLLEEMFMAEKILTISSILSKQSGTAGHSPKSI